MTRGERRRRLVGEAYDVWSACAGRGGAGVRQGLTPGGRGGNSGGLGARGEGPLPECSPRQERVASPPASREQARARGPPLRRFAPGARPPSAPRRRRDRRGGLGEGVQRGHRGCSEHQGGAKGSRAALGVGGAIIGAGGICGGAARRGEHAGPQGFAERAGGMRGRDRAKSGCRKSLYMELEKGDRAPIQEETSVVQKNPWWEGFRFS